MKCKTKQGKIWKKITGNIIEEYWLKLKLASLLLFFYLSFKFLMCFKWTQFQVQQNTFQPFLETHKSSYTVNPMEMQIYLFIYLLIYVLIQLKFAQSFDLFSFFIYCFTAWDITVGFHLY